MRVRLIHVSPYETRHKVGDVIDHPNAILLVKHGWAEPLDEQVEIDPAEQARCFEAVMAAYPSSQESDEAEDFLEAENEVEQ